MAVKQLSDGGSAGACLGQSITDLVSFYGKTPIAQKAAAAQAAVTDASGGVAAPTNGILTITGTYNSTIIANAIATIAAQTNAMQAVLVSVGLMKGSA
ncbi:hypothetical protein [Aminobacter sp. MDW-2]|uniref:hypothetical protein n=1 Tax=Aminobacter sp. MDW-2 TaxID=2666139 RepID=UPI0012AFCFEA|nr:hypothetical protein [Aminobacter sp. MDW-2]MRX31912.1 hypothetical protein [Aminobacter sp. MDW-2]QNH32385.1 hypothetical protein H5P29_17700 [Aminobacter sp. MDW-2]